jgi:hypothetical protein
MICRTIPAKLIRATQSGCKVHGSVVMAVQVASSAPPHLYPRVTSNTSLARIGGVRAQEATLALLATGEGSAHEGERININ